MKTEQAIYQFSIRFNKHLSRNHRTQLNKSMFDLEDFKESSRELRKLALSCQDDARDYQKSLHIISRNGYWFPKGWKHTPEEIREAARAAAEGQPLGENFHPKRRRDD